jgi:hypothetical protein
MLAWAEKTMQSANLHLPGQAEKLAQIAKSATKNSNT